MQIQFEESFEKDLLKIIDKKIKNKVIEIIDNIDFIADIVGPVCETGDYLAKDREITTVGRGDKLAIMSTGAYGMVMSSNYNGRRRPAEILVDGSDYKIIRSRETFKHLIFDEETFLKTE